MLSDFYYDTTKKCLNCIPICLPSFSAQTNEALLDRNKLSDQLTLASCPMSIIKNQNWMLFLFCSFGFYLQLSHKLNGISSSWLSFSFEIT